MRHVERAVALQMDFEGMSGELVYPGSAGALIVVVHADAAQARLPTERFVVEVLQAQGHGSFQVTLRPDADELKAQGSAALTDPAQRVARALVWTQRHARLSNFRLGLFAVGPVPGSVCLDVLAAAPHGVDAVVLRGVPAQLARQLADVPLPTLVLLSTPEDRGMPAERRQRLQQLDHATLRVLAEARSGFDDPGAHEAVARSAARWFGQSLHARSRAPRQPVQAWQPVTAR